MRKIIIEPYSNPLKINFSELFAYRELLWALAYRDLRVRYAQTFIGFLWAFMNPLLSLLILTFVFGVVAKVDIGTGYDGQVIPHLLYTIVGLAGWTYFSEVFAQAGMSIINAQQMVQKIYFPRLVIPLSKAITGLVDLGVNILLIAILMLFFSYTPSPNIIFLPLFIMMAIISGLAAGIWMSALTIRFRDFQYITPMLLRIGMFITPISYPSSAVPENFRALFYLNPVAGIVEGLRWSLLGGTALNPYIYISFAVIFVFLLLGIIYFNKVEKVMPDII
jgi:lipopolysaccharide transport system permease protein